MKFIFLMWQLKHDSLMLTSLTLLNLTLPIDPNFPFMEIVRSGSVVAILGYISYVQRGDLKKMQEDYEAKLEKTISRYETLLAEQSKKIDELTAKLIEAKK